MKNFLLVFTALFLTASLAFAEEEIKITTYYPAPGGVYDQMRTDKLGVGSALEVPMPSTRGGATFGGLATFMKGINVYGPIIRFNGTNAGTDYNQTNINLGTNSVVGSPSQNRGGATVLNGDSNTASGDYSIVAGEESTASGYGSVGIGGRVLSSGQYSLALGENSIASGNCTFAFGDSQGLVNTQATNKNAFAFGHAARATGDNAIAMGNLATAIKTNAIAIGNSAFASDNNSIAIGNSVNAGGPGSIVIGTGIIDGGAPRAMILKNGAIGASGTDSVAIHLDSSSAPSLNQANTLAITGGKVGIGTPSPTTTLSVNGNTTLTDGVGIGTAPNAAFYSLKIGNGPAGGYSLFVGGSVAIGGPLSFGTDGSIGLSGGQINGAGTIYPMWTSTPTYDLGSGTSRWRTLYYNGGQLPPACFLKFKDVTKWEPFKDYLSLVPPTIQFKWKDGRIAGEHLGYVGDDLPEIAKINNEAIDDVALVGILCGAIKQLEKKVNSLESKLAKLEAQDKRK